MIDLLVRILLLTSALAFVAAICCFLLGVASYAVASVALGYVTGLVGVLGNLSGLST